MRQSPAGFELPQDLGPGRLAIRHNQ
jgi:hypothetical protein